MSDIKEVLCKSYVEGACPVPCTFWDCDAFKPTEYFLSGIEKLKTK